MCVVCYSVPAGCCLLFVECFLLVVVRCLSPAARYSVVLVFVVCSCAIFTGELLLSVAVYRVLIVVIAM